MGRNVRIKPLPQPSPEGPTVRTALAGSLLLAVGLLGGAAAQEKNDAKVAAGGKAEPSPIPENLAAEAKKAFARKMTYFIWSEEKAAKAKDFNLRSAVNPDGQAEPAYTVAKFTYTAQGQKVPFTSTGDGIVGEIRLGGAGAFKGTAEVTYYLIKASDAVTKDGRPQPNAEKAPPISNTIKVKLTFE
jgi:hypothetical protein